jgi:integrase
MKNTSGKKFLFPTLYPKDLDTSKLWFIKYQVEDYKKGAFVPRKYCGALNMIADKEERIRKAKEIIDSMKRGEAPPNHQGMKRPLADHPKHFANAVHCCLKYVKDRKFELEPKTVSQYESRINHFSAWLNRSNLQHLAIGGIQKEHARDFLFYLKEELKLSNATYNDYKILFAQIWNEHIEDGKINFNPWKQIKALPDETEHMASYPPDLRITIFKTLPSFDPQLWLFVQMIYYCGVRPHCELRRVKIGDLHFDKGKLVVRRLIAKGKRKERTINVYRGLIDQMRALGYDKYPSSHYLFSVDGKPGSMELKAKHLLYRWKKYRKEFGIPDEFKMYGAKHTGGKQLSKLHNQYVTNEHFGHATMEATAHYIEGIDERDLYELQTTYPEFAN